MYSLRNCEKTGGNLKTRAWDKDSSVVAKFVVTVTGNEQSFYDTSWQSITSMPATI